MTPGHCNRGWVFAIEMAYIAEYTTAASRLAAIAFYTMASSLATTLGSIGGGWLPELFTRMSGGQANGAGAANSDYNTHSYTYYYPWLLQKLYAYKQQTGTQLLDILQGVNDDLETSIDAARRINNALPLPG